MNVRDHSGNSPNFGARLASFFLRRGMGRSLVEALAVALVLSVGVYMSGQEISGQAVFQVLVIGPLAAMYLAARARLGERGLTANLHEELPAWALFSAAIAAIGAVATSPGATLPGPSEQIFLTIFLGVWTFVALAFFRVLAYLWPAWMRLRRSRLRWEMTHTIMLVVIPMLSGLLLLFVLFVLGYSGYPFLEASGSPVEVFVMLLPVIGVIIFLTVITIGILMPPAALVSYFAARKTAARLESLSHGATGLRQGNYAIRVPVDGEDEIADVQRGFNLMAGNLERTIEDLRDERDNVERLLQAQRELVASVSHELRTPVATMRGYLESALDAEPASMRSDLEVMAGEVTRLQRLIDDLFVLTRAEAGQLPLELEPSNVAPIISRSVAAVSESAWRTGRVEVIEDVQPGMPPALVDPGRLEQVIRNLLSNAVRHTPPGGLVAVSASATGKTITIDVKDTGPGIEADKLDSIFERFYRLDDARQRDPSGAGLGLAIVRELTEAMGGRVAVTSDPGNGSCFTVTFPAP